MGLGSTLKKVASIGAVPLTGGMSLLGYPGVFDRNNPSLPYATAAPVTASGIALDPKLTAILGEQGKGPQNSLNEVYGRIRSRFGADQAARGQAPNPTGGYAGNRFDVGQNQSDLNLRGNLESVLGNTGYSQFKGNRDFQQNMQLAQLTGDINKPSTTEEILSGLGGGAQVAGQFGGLSNALGSRKKQRPTSNLSDSLSYYDPSSEGYARYQ